MALFIQGSKVLCNGAVSFVLNSRGQRVKGGRAVGLGAEPVLTPGVKMLEGNERFWGSCCLKVAFGRVGCGS